MTADQEQKHGSRPKLSQLMTPQLLPSGETDELNLRGQTLFRVEEEEKVIMSMIQNFPGNGTLSDMDQLSFFRF